MSTQNMYKKVHSSFIRDSTKQKQLRCPSIGEWLNKWENTLVMEYYSAKQGTNY